MIFPIGFCVRVTAAQLRRFSRRVVPCGVSPPGAPLGRRGETTGGCPRTRLRHAWRRRTMTAVPSHLELLPRPRVDAAVTVVAAPGSGPGHWAGAPSAVVADGTTYLAYRLRRPVGEGRGYANVVAASSDGVRFETLCVLERDWFGAESLERPALVRRPDGGWRLYVSCATPGTLHWWVDALDADDPVDLVTATRTTVFAGDANTAVKDPVVKVVDGVWHAWPCVHEIAVAADADRMHTAYCTSDDGVAWRWHGTALEGRAGHWDARGARVADVLWTGDGEAVVFYDGRATAAQNWEELTGIAAGGAGALRAHSDEPELVSPETGTGLRYLTAVPLDDGACRFYFEVTRSDGAHDLRTVLVAPS